ncbi:uncharacterized protein LOC133293763 [Gastrolobium bilobum]|uniref:uncharacterized protein LOC133293763 n=1 Tax=Gastrolobium bilobum TaxID=150636 RepID=UPI002AAF342E|nr:uncharacterized protein LOC133293763 [Gastrolobium bilobum]
MAKNRNKKKINDAVSMDTTTDPSVSEAPEAMDTSESRAQNTGAGATTLKMKQKVRPMKRTKNVRKRKAMAKAICANEKSSQKMLKNDNKKSRVQSAKTLYE